MVALGTNDLRRSRIFRPLKKSNTQGSPVVCDSPSPGTSWRNRENPAPLRVHVSATIRRQTAAKPEPELRGCCLARLLNGLNELQHVHIDLVRVSRKQTVRLARIENRLCSLYDLGRFPPGIVDRNDLVVLAVQNQCRYVELL